MKVGGRDIGVCSWSLRPKDTDDLVARVRALGLEHVQIGLVPLLNLEPGARAAEVAQLRDCGLTITATQIAFPGEDFSTIAMIRRTAGLMPDELWPQRREIALAAGRLGAELGRRFMTMHLGFVPASSDPAYKTLVNRAAEIAQPLAELGVDLLFETGQEPGYELLQFLNDLNCRNVGVNLDPANMILYGFGDPIEMIEALNRHIMHVHLKDAISSSQPGIQWGKEVPFGRGEVLPELLLDALDEIGYEGPLVIEREPSDHSDADIAAAVDVLRELE